MYKRQVEGLLKKDDNKDAVPLDVFKNGINKYYDSLLKLGNNSKEEILLNEKYTENEIKMYKEKMIKVFDLIYDDLKQQEMQKEYWIKIFFKKDIEEYKRVSEIYI